MYIVLFGSLVETSALPRLNYILIILSVCCFETRQCTRLYPLGVGYISLF